MNSFYDIMDDKPMYEMFQPMNTTVHYYQCQSSTSYHPCVICGSKSIGINFGALTCAPCKAFFRRNAKRKELLDLPCRHRDLSALLRNSAHLNERAMRYLQIRRCSSCRLRRCFDMGMKEELVRTDEENDRHRQLVEFNRTRRELLKQQLIQIKQLSIAQTVFNNAQLSGEIDWCHLSNIVYAYDTFCLKTFTQQKSTVIFNENQHLPEEQSTNKHPTTLTMSVVLSVSAFLKSLPAYNALPRIAKNYLSKTNIRPLIFPNIHEINKSCFSEPWQAAVYEATWEFMCGPELYKDFVQAERLAEKLWINEPIVIRLWFITLFFSTPLHYHNDYPTTTPILKKKLPVLQAQNAYVTLLWKYLTHRYGFQESIRLYMNLVHVYIKMQTVGFGIYLRLRTHNVLKPTNETINELVTIDINEDS